MAFVSSSVEVEFSIVVECAKCGHTLAADFKNGCLDVDPCETCLKDAHEEGREEAEKEAQP